MCGRFASTTPASQLADYFGAGLVDPVDIHNPRDSAEPRFNIAPTDVVPAVVDHSDARVLDRLHWGLVPFWAKDPKVGSRMINARAETVLTKNAFSPSLERRRTIIPADGFYEWQKIEGRKAKQPMFIQRVDNEPLAFAGLWAIWRDKNHLDDDGEPRELHSCTIITCPANETMASIHDRMPVILPPSAWDEWLDREQRDAEEVARLLVPAPNDLLTMHPVSTAVNNVRNDGPELVAEVEPEVPAIQDSLDI